MKLSSCVLALIPAGSLVFGNVLPRDASTVLTDLATIKTQLTKVAQDVNSYQGSNVTVTNAVTIKTDSDTVDSSLQKAASDVASSSTFTDAESASIANAVVGLQPLIFSTLQSLVDKRASFGTAALGFDATSLVHDSVVQLRTDTGNFGNNITAKLSPTLAKLAPLLTSNLDFHYVRAIQAFS